MQKRSASFVYIRNVSALEVLRNRALQTDILPTYLLTYLLNLPKGQARK